MQSDPTTARGPPAPLVAADGASLRAEIARLQGELRRVEPDAAKRRRHGQGTIEWLRPDDYLWVRGALRWRRKRYYTEGIGVGRVAREDLSDRAVARLEREIGERLTSLAELLRGDQRPDYERRRRLVREQGEIWLRGKTTRLLDKTHAKYAAAFATWVDPFPLGRVELGELRPEDVARWLAEIRATGASSSQIRYAYDRLTQMLTELHTIDGAQFAGLILIVKGREDRRPRHRAHPTRAFDEAEAGALLRLLLTKRETDPPFAIFFATATFAGLRFAEAQALPWAEVHDTEASLTVRWQWDAKARKPVEPKSEAGVRTIPLVPEALELLRWHKARELAAGRPCGATDLVFRIVGRDRKVRELPYMTARRRLIAFCSAAGLGEMGATHVLRHTFGTAAGASGFPTHLLQGIMGHADPATTAIYTRFLDADAAVARDRLGRRLGPAATPE